MWRSCFRSWQCIKKCPRLKLLAVHQEVPRNFPQFRTGCVAASPTRAHGRVMARAMNPTTAHRALTALTAGRVSTISVCIQHRKIQLAGTATAFATSPTIASQVLIATTAAPVPAQIHATGRTIIRAMTEDQGGRHIARLGVIVAIAAYAQHRHSRHRRSIRQRRQRKLQRSNRQRRQRTLQLKLQRRFRRKVQRRSQLFHQHERRWCTTELNQVCSNAISVTSAKAIIRTVHFSPAQCHSSRSILAP